MKKLLYKEPSVRILCIDSNDIVTASNVDDETFNLNWLDESLFS